ncbi:MAG: hypothetical protein ABIR29_00380 [Chthoniobacterales bacterium]
MNSVLYAGKILAIQLFFGLTFLLAALVKWRVGMTPGFRQQFGSTWLASLPGGLSAVFYFLAVLETIALLGLIVGLLGGEFLPGKTKRFLKLTLLHSLCVFTVLSFGRA